MRPSFGWVRKTGDEGFAAGAVNTEERSCCVLFSSGRETGGVTFCRAASTASWGRAGVGVCVVFCEKTETVKIQTARMQVPSKTEADIFTIIYGSLDFEIRSNPTLQIRVHESWQVHKRHKTKPQKTQNS